jgi:hypothetical protein
VARAQASLARGGAGVSVGCNVVLTPARRALRLRHAKKSPPGEARLKSGDGQN